MPQKIEVKIEQAYLNRPDLYFCLYVDGKFISCPYRLEDYGKVRGSKKWLKDVMFTKEVQDNLGKKKKV